MPSLPDFTEEQLLLLAAAAFLANPARFTNADKDIPELKRMGNAIRTGLGRRSMGDEKVTPYQSLMIRRAGEKPEMERRVKQALRGMAISERMVDAFDKKLVELGSNGRYELTATDIKLALKAAIMEYGK